MTLDEAYEHIKQVADATHCRYWARDYRPERTFVQFGVVGDPDMFEIEHYWPDGHERLETVVARLCVMMAANIDPKLVPFIETINDQRRYFPEYGLIWSNIFMCVNRPWW